LCGVTSKLAEYFVDPIPLGRVGAFRENRYKATGEEIAFFWRMYESYKGAGDGGINWRIF
jgi:hypothetical protein